MTKLATKGPSLLQKTVAVLTKVFTWWNGQTLNTRFHTWRHGELAGSDESGNLYYRTKGGAIDKALGFERRWVVFSGYSDPTTVPPGWHGWLHHTVDTPPTEEKYTPKEWQKPHQPNLTGTPQAWRPQGSTLRANARPAATGDYEAWSPEG